MLMKLGMMLEVDETFTTIWLSRSSKVRRWPQSPWNMPFGSIGIVADGERTGDKLALDLSPVVSLSTTIWVLAIQCPLQTSLTTKMASRSTQPFFHNLTTRQTDRLTDRWDRRQVCSNTRQLFFSSCLIIILFNLIIVYILTCLPFSGEIKLCVKFTKPHYVNYEI